MYGSKPLQGQEPCSWLKVHLCYGQGKASEWTYAVREVIGFVKTQCAFTQAQ